MDAQQWLDLQQRVQQREVAYQAAEQERARVLTQIGAAVGGDVPVTADTVETVLTAARKAAEADLAAAEADLTAALAALTDALGEEVPCG